MIGSEQMNNSQSKNKTIDLNSTKRQRSSKNIERSYFNPYDRSAEDTVSNPYGYTKKANDYYDSTNYSGEKYKGTVSSEQRKKELKVYTKPSKKEMRRSRRKRRIHFVVKTASLMAVIIIGVWGILTLKDTIAYPKISYQIVQTGSIDTSQTFEGIIVRAEKVYYSQNDGMMQPIIAEGEKVKKNGTVCILTNHTELQQTEQEKSQVSTELYNYADTRKQFSYYADDIYQIDTSINQTINTFYGERLKDSTEYIYGIRNELDNYVNKRTQVFAKEQSALNNRTAKQLTELDTKINSLQTASRPEEAGVVSYRIDGEENNLNPEIFDKITYSTYKAFQQKSYQNMGNNTSVTKGMPLYKIIYDHIWYIVTYCDASQAEAYKEGENYSLYFNAIDQMQISFKLRSKVTEDNKIKMIFAANERIGHFLNLRSVDFSIGNKNEEGLKIPLQAIVEQNLIKIPLEYKVEKEGDIGVYRKNGELIEFIKISPQYEKDGYIYILQQIGNTEGIKLNDILQRPDTNQSVQISEVQVTEGVYVINGKLATFKAVDVYLKNKEYALIKYSPNNELKELDKIISNPKSIKRDQLLQHMNIQNE